VAEELYRKFTRERLYEQVAAHVEQLVTNGKLQVGDRLPPERELAERLGVARGVVREAVKLLAVRGLVTIEPGRGTFIVENSAGSISEHLAHMFRMGKISYRDLNELRQVLEVQIARLAAQRATPDNLADMRQAVEEMDQNIASPEEYIAADLDFHLALASATHNRLFELLISIIVDLLQTTRRMIFEVPGAPQRGQVWHRLVYEAVSRGNAGDAAEAMEKHMQQISQDTALGETAHAGLSVVHSE
jgi:GntR family transcriptional repressor for pyruvate dehydrogenase complex